MTPISNWRIVDELRVRATIISNINDLAVQLGQPLSWSKLP